MAAARAASIVVPFFSKICRPMIEHSTLSTATAARAYLPKMDEPLMTYVSWAVPQTSFSSEESTSKSNRSISLHMFYNYTRRTSIDRDIFVCRYTLWFIFLRWENFSLTFIEISVSEGMHCYLWLLPCSGEFVFAWPKKMTYRSLATPNIETRITNVSCQDAAAVCLSDRR